MKVIGSAIYSKKIISIKDSFFFSCNVMKVIRLLFNFPPMSPIIITIITIQREITLSRILFLLVDSPYILTSLFSMFICNNKSETENSYS